MTSQSAIFKHVVNLVLSTSRSVSKKYLDKIYLKKLKFLLLTGEIVKNVYSLSSKLTDFANKFIDFEPSICILYSIKSVFILTV